MPQIKQVAPDYDILTDMVSKLRYKAAWRFILDDIDRGQGSYGTTLIIQITVPDSYNPDDFITVNHYMLVPPASYNHDSWKRWLFDQILLVEQHEAAEFFILDGLRPYAPHHGPGNNPYTIFDQGSREDA